jgi:hypothetical protein
VSMLRVVLTCASGDAMGDIVIQLSGYRFNDLLGGGTVFVAVYLHSIVVFISIFVMMIFSDGGVDRFEDGIKAVWDACGLNISGRFQESERVSVDANQVIVEMIGIGVVVVLNLDVRIWDEESLNVGEVYEDRARRLIAV